METLKNGKERLYYVDWLRVFAFGLLFFFHAARFFDDYGWHVKNLEHSSIVNFFVSFTHGWRMHLIFFISGIGTFFAMRSRKGEFVKDRFKRLIIPYLFGIVVLVPPQKFFEAVYKGFYNGSVIETFFISPVRLFGGEIGVSLQWVGYFGYHIWYLAFLFVMTLAALPLLKMLTKENALSILIKKISDWKYGIFLFLLPIIMFSAILKPLFPGYLNWADFFIYGSFFLMGFIFMTHRKFLISTKKYTYHFLSIGLISFFTGLYFQYNSVEFLKGLPGHLLGSVVESLIAFSFVLFCLGISQKFMNFNHRYLQNLNVGILPFYILHQTIIIIIGFYIVPLKLGILVKFLMILSLSLAATIFIYMIIKRINILRILFGMKSLKKKNLVEMQDKLHQSVWECENAT